MTSPTTSPAPLADGWVQVLDAQALDKLRALDPEGRAGLVARVVGTYVGSLRRLTAQFADARAAGDSAGLRHVAHTLKSSSASVGALALSALCMAVEHHVRDGSNGDALEPKLEAMALEAARVLSALDGERPS